MKDQFDELKNSWQEAKKEQPATDSSAMLNVVLEKQSRSKRAHIETVLVLSFTVIGLIAFFYYLAPMQELLSRIGIGLMLGSLLVRIIIELVSHRKAAQLDYSVSSRKSAKQAWEFLQYRKRIHGNFTLVIIVLYTIGFYALTPELMKYFSAFWMWMIDGSYLVIGVVLFIVIRKGVVEEINDLKRIEEVQRSLEDSPQSRG